MVAILLVAFAGVGAIAADVGRFQVVATEVQNARWRNAWLRWRKKTTSI